MSSSLRRGDAGRRRLDRGHAIPEADLALSDPAEAVVRVEVLVQDDLEAGRVALVADDRRPREEEVPDAEPALAVGREDRGLVAEPVVVPAADRPAVVRADVLDRVRLPAGLLHLLEHRRGAEAR